MYSNVTTSTRINIFKCTYVHLCLFHSKLMKLMCSNLHWFVGQYHNMVSEWWLYLHLFNKENIWSNPCSFLHTSSHPDKYNNSVNRIISKGKEREREDPRRDSSKTSKTFIPVPARIQECFQCFYTQSSKLQLQV